MQIMKTANMTKLMLNLMKMLMMNIMEIYMCKPMYMYHHSILSTKFWRMSKGYVFAHAISYDVSNNSNAKEPDESSPVHYHLPPSPQFEHIDNFGNVISSD